MALVMCGLGGVMRTVGAGVGAWPMSQRYAVPSSQGSRVTICRCCDVTAQRLLARCQANHEAGARQWGVAWCAVNNAIVSCQCAVPRSTSIARSVRETAHCATGLLSLVLRVEAPALVVRAASRRSPPGQNIHTRARGAIVTRGAIFMIASTGVNTLCCCSAPASDVSFRRVRPETVRLPPTALLQYVYGVN